MAQINAKNGDIEYNMKKATTMINGLAKKGADIIVFPEFFSTGFYEKDEDSLYHLAIKNKEIIEKTLKKEAIKNKVYIVAPIVDEKDLKGVLYNSTYLIDDNGEIIGKYSKTHLANEERKFFKPGNKYEVFKTKFGNIGILTCFDACFPENSRILALMGADIIIISTAWDKEYEYYWDTFMRARATENLLYVVSVNLALSNEATYLGKSVIYAPDRKIKELKNEEDYDIGQIDLNQLYEVRCDNNFLRARRPELYNNIIELH